MMRHLILKNSHRQLRRDAKAYSLPELLLVVVVTTVIGVASYPVIGNLSGASSYAEAHAKAEALTAAKILYRKSDPEANASWQGTNEDSARFGLLRPYLQGLPSDASLADFNADPPYDQLNLGSTLRDRVSVVESE